MQSDWQRPASESIRALLFVRSCKDKMRKRECERRAKKLPANEHVFENDIH